MDVRILLNQVKKGEITVEEAEEQLKKLPYEDLGCAKLDHHRGLRTGFGEVIYCEGKSVEQLRTIYGSFAARKENVLGTRASLGQYESLREEMPELCYDPVSRVLCLAYQETPRTGCVAVCTAGTSDIPVAEEAARVAEYFGSRTERIFDVGVAGIHRLLSRLEDIRKANCVIAVAGMEGALPGVLAGMLDKPVIAVPTSVGYGASFGGISALLTMLNSCAEGVAVVNIDNGFGAGYLAAQINRLAGRKRENE